MKFADVLSALLEGKTLYNSDYHMQLKISEEPLWREKSKSYSFLSNHKNEHIDITLDLLISEKWSVLE